MKLMESMNLSIVKKYIFLIGAVILLALPAGQDTYAAVDTINVFIDGKEMVFESPPFIEKDHVLVPVRGIAEALNFDVAWEPGSNRVIIQSKPERPEKLIDIYIGRDAATVDDRVVMLDVPAKIVNGRTYVPLRFIGESMGAEVSWDEKSNTAQISNPAQSPLLKGKTADAPFSVLAGRFSIKMPAGSVDEAVNHGGIMGSMSDSSEETRITLSADKQEFYLYAQELFRYSTGDLSKDAGLFIKNSADDGTGFVLSGLIRASNIEYIVITPKEIKVQDSTLVQGALLKLPDNTLVYLGIYANAQALIYKEDCVAMAGSVIESIGGGKRVLNKDPRTVKLFGYSLALEKNYVYSVQLGPDFDVCYFYKLVPMGEDQPTFGIYSGGFPSQFGSHLPSREEKSDIVLGQNIIWNIYCNKKGVMDKDTFVETLFEHDGWYKHIFAHPKSRSEWLVIEKMIHTLEVLK